MPKTIEITFDEHGEARIEAKGYRGRSCATDTRPFEEALGVVAGPRHLKPEFHQVAESTVKAGGGR
jgi:hypothetical protein